MRAVLVVLRAEAIERDLLTMAIGRRRPRRLALERAVHPLVRPVLLGTRRPEALMLDAQPHPPHVELREPVNARRRERHAVVGADGAGQAVLGAPVPRRRGLCPRLLAAV